MNMIKLMQGDCLELMKTIPDGSVDMVMTDPPYGTTACKWDTVIPFEPMWEHLKRVIKPNGAIVLTASQPFTSALVMSNVKMFKYCWVWEKTRPTGHVHAKNKPMKRHEDLVVFSPGTTDHASQSKTRMCYNPQGLEIIDRVSHRPSRGVSGSDVVGSLRPSHKATYRVQATGYPTTVIKIPSEHNVGAYHPTQKPVALFEYLIKTYTNEGETVLDFACGSGTTGVACVNLGRKFIGIELDPGYFKIAQARIAAPCKAKQLELF